MEEFSIFGAQAFVGYSFTHDLSCSPQINDFNSS